MSLKATMSETPVQTDEAVFVKTATGQQEIQSRALGLGLMARRALILIDGKRSVAELAPMLAGQDLRTLLQELLDKACIEPSLSKTPTAPPVPPTPSTAEPKPAPASGNAIRTTSATNATDGVLSKLPPAESRGATELTMARNFMTNTVNTIFQPYTRLTLLEAIADCKTAHDARKVYLMWEQTIGSSPIGAKRLPEFREKLFKVL